MVWKEQIFNSFYIGTVWWSLKNCFLTLSTLEGYGGLEITDFNNFYLGRVWWSGKN